MRLFGILWIVACILGVIWEAFWGSLASVKLVFRVSKTSSGDFWGVPCQHLFQDLFSEGTQRAFLWIWDPIWVLFGDNFQQVGHVFGVLV